ncbi:hypothetical protein ACZ11_09690 [Lysinibacillus xylanilyticus]|uniref:Uncharacterized protein n=1 Tax=Lysinibacillus xylanilyticus TaxID=582475 RepID=A0A0K9FE17_9BACI|nr:hypothetical protein ACZ11_09690 [Lysinibacillus xylanilyticus]
MKLYKSAKEPEIYHYFNVNKEKLWMFRHKYYDAAGKRRENEIPHQAKGSVGIINKMAVKKHLQSVDGRCF